MDRPAPVQLQFTTVDVFTSTRYLGNPLAVVLVPAAHRSTLTRDIKQRIAREFNLSETVFLHTPPESDAAASSREIDIFTPTEELPFAGHPTIGTAYLVLHHLRWTHVNTLVTKAGPIRIAAASVAGGGAAVRAAIPHAVHVHGRTLRAVLPADGPPAQHAALSDDAAMRDAELDAPVVSIVRGMTFVLVRLPGLDELGRVSTSKRLDFGALKGLLDEGEWGGGFVARYYYVAGENEPLRTRMVELGFEDPATGSAACTLASYLALAGAGTKTGGGGKFGIQQGVEMGRRSDIEVEVELETGPDGARRVKELFLGGTAVVILKGTIDA